MPRILARDPSWLSASSAGSTLFQPSVSTKAAAFPDVKHEGALRKIAHRGTEVFVAVGNELRWSELGLVKDIAEDHERRHGRRWDTENGEDEGEKAYRVLKTPVSRPITQLSISSSGDYMAILTSHTCHVCILPSSSHLRPQESSPLRLKTFQLGPTAHVLEQAPLVQAIWHPLSPSGDCLLTVSHDACIRLWELDSENRSSFDEPALAIDLRKLGNATTAGIDFSASKYGTNKGYSPDDVEMQVAAACFGGQGSEEEHGWASMTLWVAMTEGDVYALCPFLPSRWRAPATLLPSLSTSVIEKSRAIRQDPEASEGERRTIDQQTKWLAEVDSQDPLLLPGSEEFDTIEVYTRPERLNAVPKLQGPFQISPEPDFGEVTDIHVIAPKIDDEALYDDDNEDPAAEEGLSVSVVCLATSTNEIHVCLDVDGVEAAWLPIKRSRAYTFDDDDDEKALILFETIDLARSEEEDDGWPTFTPSPNDRYELFVTDPAGVCSLSFKPWIGPLEDELAAASGSGAAFRINVLLDSSSTLATRPIEISSQPGRDINAAIAIYEPSLGCTLLTSAQNSPYAAILDVDFESHPYAPDEPSAVAALTAPEPRAPYRPAAEFSQPSHLPQLVKSARERAPSGSNGDIKSAVRFSPATLHIMTEAHRIMSSETHKLGIAAADLFRRCERMRAELREQVRKVAEIAQRVDVVTGQDEEGQEDHEEEDDGGEGRLSGKDKIEHRYEQVREKNAELAQTVERLRRKGTKLGGTELSAKERAFADEVDRLEKNLQSIDPSSLRSKTGATLSTRFDAVQALQKDIVPRATHAAEQTEQGQADAPATPSDSMRASTTVVGGEFRRQRLAQVMQLLERETALVEAVMERLGRLQQRV